MRKTDIEGRINWKPKMGSNVIDKVNMKIFVPVLAFKMR